jgi:hypothetical protein
MRIKYNPHLCFGKKKETIQSFCKQPFAGEAILWPNKLWEKAIVAFLRTRQEF